MPVFPFAAAHLAPAPFSCALEGLKVTATGKSAPASLPDTGLSPALAPAALIPALQSPVPAGPDLLPDFRLITLTHARLGEPTFGIASGQAELCSALRAPPHRCARIRLRWPARPPPPMA